MTRNEILEASAQIFSQKGFHAASMQEIAQAVNLQKASLYHHFKSKQEILAALLDRALDLLINQMEMVLAMPLPPDEKLRKAVEVYLQVLLENRELAAVLLLEHRSLSYEHAALHIQRRDHFERLWRRLVEEGKQSGDFCCKGTGLTVRALLGVMNSTVTWYRPEGSLSRDEIAAQFADLFLFGLLTRMEADDPRS